MQKLLLELLAQHISDGAVMELIDRFLKQGVMESGKEWLPTETGTPQGAVMTPCTQWITIRFRAAGIANTAHQWETMANGDPIVDLDDDLFNQEPHHSLPFRDTQALG